MALLYLSQLLSFSKKNNLKDLEMFINTKFGQSFLDSVSDVENKYPDFLLYWKVHMGIDYECTKWKEWLDDKIFIY